MSHLSKCYVSLATPYDHHAMCSSPKVPSGIHMVIPCVTQHPDILENVKFRMSWNPTKFDEVTRFHETNSTVKSVSSSEF